MPGQGAVSVVREARRFVTRIVSLKSPLKLTLIRVSLQVCRTISHDPVLDFNVLDEMTEFS